eukprot:GHVU01223314.1.p1 GENE.GHVU01223314.1~~GHVU01223314.1.p1  ORF type:complete len:374 (+),score=68.28 GHVU01223314.1:102-1124(+)
MLNSSDVADSLKPVQKELDHLLESIKKCTDAEALKHLQGRVNKIDGERVNGHFGGAEEVPAGQAALHTTLFHCYQEIRGKELILDKRDEQVDPKLKPIQHELEGIIRALRKNRQEDGTNLKKYQGMLDHVDTQRKGGIFGPADTPLKGQAVLHDLLSEAYSLVREAQLHEGDSIVAPSLVDIERKLYATLHAIETYHGDEAGLRLLQARIHHFDNMQVDGVFFKQPNGDIPAGQAAVKDVMQKCYDAARAKQEALEKETVHPQLQWVEKELDSILRALQEAKHDEESLPKIQGRLDKIDSMRHSGVFGNPLHILPGQAALHDKMSDAYTAVHRIQAGLLK